MLQTHGELLKCSVHKHNSLEHLRASGSRPGSAARRPASGHARPRPQSAAARAPPKRAAEKSEAEKTIDGETGPPMVGVSTFAYSRLQAMYKDDVQIVVAGTITHPYTAITAFNVGSVPHHLITGARGTLRRGVGARC